MTTHSIKFGDEYDVFGNKKMIFSNEDKHYHKLHRNIEYRKIICGR